MYHNDWQLRQCRLMDERHCKRTKGQSTRAETMVMSLQTATTMPLVSDGDSASLPSFPELLPSPGKNTISEKPRVLNQKRSSRILSTPPPTSSKATTQGCIQSICRSKNSSFCQAAPAPICALAPRVLIGMTNCRVFQHRQLPSVRDETSPAPSESATSCGRDGALGSGRSRSDAPPPLSLNRGRRDSTPRAVAGKRLSPDERRLANNPPNIRIAAAPPPRFCASEQNLLACPLGRLAEETSPSPTT